MEFLTEKDLIQKARRGDQEAIDRLYEGTKNYAWFIAKRYLRNDEDVADVLQESYISAFTKLNTFAEGKSFKTWLHTIVVNRCLNLLKKRKVIYISTDSVTELADNDEELLPAEWVERAEKRRDIMRIIDALPEGQRMAISLFYIEGLPLSEMAEVMGISEGTVKSHLARGRKAIKEAVLLEEKKGNKLYGIGFVPLLTQLFEKEAEAAVMPEEMSKTVWQGVQSGLATAGGPGAGQQGGSGTCGQTIHNSDTGGASGTAAKNAAKAATKVISKKAIIAAISVIGAAAVITAGIVFLPPLFNSPSETIPPGVSDTQTPRTITPDNTPDTTASDFEYHNDAALGGVVITKYIGKSDTVKVPETIGGKPVVKVDDTTFQDCGSLVSITTLYLDGYFASDITVTKDGDGVTNIHSKERGLFNGCDALEDLTVIVPSSVTEIIDFAFMNCNQLTDVVISDSVTEIGEGIFWFCGSLKTVKMPYSSGSFYWVQTEDGSVYNKDFFNGCDSLESVTVFVPDSITRIDDEAFAYFDELTDVIIPNSVTTIGDNIFANSSSLKNVTMYHHGEIFFDSYINFYEDGVSVHSTGSGGQFQGCDSLESVTVIISDGVTKIENYAFIHSQITDIVIPDSVTYIGDDAFGACESMVNINIPNGVTYIGDSAFMECRSLKSIIIPDSVTSVGSLAFQSCDSLESVTIGDGITAIDTAMFIDLKSLATVKIGNNVTTIGAGAFSGCESLENVNIPNGVQVIGATAFRNCKALTSIAIPDSVAEIGSYAFDGIPDLTATYKNKTYKSEEKTPPGQEDSKYYIMPDEFYDAINNG